MKKVLFVINTLGCAGAEKAMIELIKLFSQYDVSVYVLLDQGELIRELPSNVKVINKNYKAESVLNKKGTATLSAHVLKRLFMHFSIFRNIFYILGNLFKMILQRNVHIDKLLWRTMSDSGMRIEDHYDLAIAYLEGGSTYYVHDHIDAKRKVAFLHVDYNQAGYSRSLDKDCYLDFDHVFGVSDEVKESLVNVYPEIEDKISVFHNILNVDEIHKKADSGEGFNDKFDGKRILTVGRLASQKAYDIAIDAMKILDDRGINAKWYVIGEGKLHRKLQKKIEENNLENIFILLGAKENPYPYYKECDLYVHATRFEGKSIAIQEAQILGKPILVSDCCGNREQVREGIDGYFCGLNAEDIADKIAFLLSSPEIMKKIGIAAQKKYQQEEVQIQELFDME